MCLKRKILSQLTSNKRELSTDIRKPFTSIPGPISLPVIGTLYQYIPLIGKYKFTKLETTGLKKYKKFGSIVKEEIAPGVNIVWLYDPNDIEHLFRNEGIYPRRRSHLALEKYRLDKPHVYNTGGLLPTNGENWWKLRQVFQKGLSSPMAVHNFISGSNEIIDEFLDRINYIKEYSNVDYLPEISRLFLELMCLSVFDVRMDSFSEIELRKNSRSTKLLKSALTTNSCILKLDNGFHLWKHFATPLYWRMKRAQTYMEDVAIDLVGIKMHTYEELPYNHPKCLMDIYLRSKDLDFKDIIGISCDFLLAGMDTTSYTTSFLLYYLALNKEVQNRLWEEVKRLLPNSNSPVTKEVLAEAHYAKACLKETHRLRPISVGVGRILDRPTVFSGYEVPEDTIIVTQNQVSCRLEDYFPEANKFLPERWLKNDPLYRKIHPFLVLPFGHGKRSCIARRLAEQNMLILLLKISRCYEVGWIGYKLDTISSLINKPDGPILLNFQAR